MMVAISRNCSRLVIMMVATLALLGSVTCKDQGAPAEEQQDPQTLQTDIEPPPAKTDLFADPRPTGKQAPRPDSGAKRTEDDTWFLGGAARPAEVQQERGAEQPQAGPHVRVEPRAAVPSSPDSAAASPSPAQPPPQVLPKWRLFGDREPVGPEADSPSGPRPHPDADLRSRAAMFAAARQTAAPATPKVLSLRLEALAKRVAHMHKTWEAARHTGETRSALSMEAMQLSRRLDPVIARTEGRATVSVHVRDLKSQHVLFDHKGEELRNPASNQKMLTASAALDLLGPEYKFETHVYRVGRTLHVVGEGDPTLTVDHVVGIAKAIGQDLGAGDIQTVVFDDTAFSKERFIPGIELDNVGFSYAAPTGALSMNDNSVQIIVRPTSPGMPAQVIVRPQNAHVQVSSTALTARHDDADARVYVRTKAAGEHTVVEVSGTINKGSEPLVERRRIYDPTAFAGATFVEALGEATGGPIPEMQRGPRPENAHLLRSWSSRPLYHVAKQALAFSNNFATEQILRTLAWRMTGEPGSFELGAKALESYWATIGVSPESLVAENGSGLSRGGRFTATGLIDLVSAAYMTQPANSGLIAVLPGAGEPGTLRHRQTQARGRLRAKTGTLNGVSALTGVLRDLDGEAALALSIMINPGATGKMSTGERHALEEEIVNALLEHLRARRRRQNQRRRN